MSYSIPSSSRRIGRATCQNRRQAEDPVLPPSACVCCACLFFVSDDQEHAVRQCKAFVGFAMQADAMSFACQSHLVADDSCAQSFQIAKPSRSGLGDFTFDPYAPSPMSGFA
ncbi:MAG: hypothetical protein IE919_15665 [Thioclava sp.]|nr:hypothetical protein [Thioclava sp.]MBD3804661.1 hypothetical protein [Thioclava sp.]